VIKEKTVYIFGAGLSKAYKFPTNSGLRDRIVQLLNWNGEDKSVQKSIEILREFNCEFPDIQRVRKDLIRSFNTIDEFLEMRTNKAERKIGKLAIAMALIEKEIPEISELTNKNDDFYWFIFHRMADETTNAENFKDNNVSFVTFNYDRSFEHVLSKKLASYYPDIMPHKVHSIMHEIKIVHVHGMLGGMEWQESPREFNPRLDKGTVEIASKGIVTFDEVKGSDSTYTEAKALIKEAQHVYFIGFGFHPRNLQRLIEGDILKNQTTISGTRLGINQRDLDKIAAISKGKLNGDTLHKLNAVEFSTLINSP